MARDATTSADQQSAPEPYSDEPANTEKITGPTEALVKAMTSIPDQCRIEHTQNGKYRMLLYFLTFRYIYLNTYIIFPLNVHVFDHIIEKDSTLIGQW